ncbi:MAG: DegT/DnrJ/EryC1/StrS family aminotransferase, partial [Promethearchaeota archaeon]
TTLEGGMITTNDKRFADRARLMRSHGMTKTAYDREKKYAWYYDVTELGYNYRMNEVEASIGISQLKKLDQMNEQRQEKAKYLTEKLSHIKGIIPPHEAENRNHIFHLYVIRVLADSFGINRDRLFEKLSKEGIGLSLHYTPLHLLSFYKSKYGYKKGDFPVAERLYNEILSLPVYPQISEEQLDFVIEQIASNAITGK